MPDRHQVEEKRQQGELESSTDPCWQEEDERRESQAGLAPLLPLSAASLPQDQTSPSPAARATARQPGAEPHQESQMAIPPRPQEDAGLPGTNTFATEREEDSPSEPVPTYPSQPIPPLARTPGDLQLARVAIPDPSEELGRLLERLAVDIHLELGRAQRPPLLRLNLPELGELAIRIARHPGELQVEILTTSQGQSQLSQGRGELLDRLQRLYPGEQVSLDLFTRGDSEQGSRQRRSLYEEWDADA
ncbi:type III secretion system needle length determinant [Aeromonas sp. AE23HZ002T15]